MLFLCRQLRLRRFLGLVHHLGGVRKDRFLNVDDRALTSHILFHGRQMSYLILVLSLIHLILVELTKSLAHPVRLSARRSLVTTTSRMLTANAEDASLRRWFERATSRRHIEVGSILHVGYLRASFI